ncbi:biotin transport system substrate-specific component [Cytobacillus oceanisediminis]|uniref:Biotin transporter n=1 Tax=Cytobacillus oceanisediminis TaxID=665099 RepID=A0A2V3A4C1_9BACI|nr:biotin transporter BioY [Cytobacillus oceanisediminis]PWW28394.1 biotin transport system substrate-specific component [Cytobacillus oceanisediminis]
MKGLKTQDLVLCGLFAALMGIGANLSPFLMIGSVPITLQLLFAILAGGILGSRIGSMAMLVYMFIGLIGVPVFAQFKGGPAQILSPTFGFILSFVLVAFVTGKLVAEQRKATRNHYIFAGFLSILCNYFIGTNWMYLSLKLWADAPKGFSYSMAWGWMAAYLPLDLAVTFVSFALLPKLQRSLKKSFTLRADI